MKRTTFSNVQGNVKVRTTLFGDVSDERWEAEHRVQRWRLDQLQPFVKSDYEYHIDDKGMAYPVIDGKIRWGFWDIRDED